ncbi:hypothetical protein BABINDRAFT_164463 [Babjeviella inositovora NRRL Y-12698]|uniref:Uncharacterized protein n=1 Tax=Babjeviella inositovora NRRL Y-12698 TaxID=984486 RepID=A0A1E3QYL9_9ASCO|nr:uncharacterized protein BABINDRAFT_164463 [Babjeviella inositovora NRRL Y-12698]ODQ82715.1 hypothetical protein BABINDRAFT_164463 [Babjeviella inositovora NRRL Y-12698]
MTKLNVTTPPASASIDGPKGTAKTATDDTERRMRAEEKREFSEARRAQLQYASVIKTNLEGLPDTLLHNYEEDAIIPAGQSKFLYKTVFSDPDAFFDDKQDVVRFLKAIRLVVRELVKDVKENHSKMKFETRDAVTAEAKDKPSQEAVVEFIQSLHFSPSTFNLKAKTLSIIVSSIDTMDKTLAQNIKEYMKAYVSTETFLPKKNNKELECRIKPIWIRSSPKGFLGTIVVGLLLPNYRAGVGGKILKRLLQPNDVIMFGTVPSAEDCDLLSMTTPYGLTMFYFVVRIASEKVPNVEFAWRRFQVRLKVLAGRKWCTVEGPPRPYGVRGERASCLMHLTCDKCGLENEVFGCLNFS